jgi:hypothetical protein
MVLSMEVFSVKLIELQPSQLYICAEKIEAVEGGMRSAGADVIDPLPVKWLGGRIVLMDGHTRALAAYRQGYEFVQVYWENEELDWEAYEICVQWCLEEGIQSIADLQSRIVGAERYKELWYKRCRRMHEQLAEQRSHGENQAVLSWKSGI